MRVDAVAVFISFFFCLRVRVFNYRINKWPRRVSYVNVLPILTIAGQGSVSTTIHYID